MLTTWTCRFVTTVPQNKRFPRGFLPVPEPAQRPPIAALRCASRFNVVLRFQCVSVCFRRPMKFLDIPNLAMLTTYLSGKELGDFVLVARIEAYSCAMPAAAAVLSFRARRGPDVSLPRWRVAGPPFMSTSLPFLKYFSLTPLRGCPLFNIPPPPCAPSGVACATGKAAGEDKKLGKILEKQYATEAALDHTSSPKSPLLTATPLGDLSEASTRRLLINLIATLNASFPDYDFRYSLPHCALLPGLLLRCVGSGW